ncbi:hypothetical protein SAMN04487949_3820 [Halogranum gelatinilyticum]|uniref:Uncharacterized protein n=1 Tax=Halogranum gelatinilyticum TaxID=660521 RepID=A0A1H0A414_9EURY|nr:hypothetical protein [Halogranum gelatinilyticum]SDN28175.1 hypothetical protein SAMN04487949_3820 [Halogranum gelatinilyticum]
MTAFDDYDCQHCGETYRALDGSNAVATGYCSPRCESGGKGL